MVKCHKDRERLVVQTTHITINIEVILGILKDVDSPEAQSWKASLEKALNACRLIRYYSIPYERSKPCKLSECCRLKKPGVWYAEGWEDFGIF